MPCSVQGNKRTAEDDDGAEVWFPFGAGIFHAHRCWVQAPAAKRVKVEPKEETELEGATPSWLAEKHTVMLSNVPFSATTEQIQELLAGCDGGVKAVMPSFYVISIHISPIEVTVDPYASIRSQTES